jgi:hypothetical protein
VQGALMKHANHGGGIMKTLVKKYAAAVGLSICIIVSAVLAAAPQIATIIGSGHYELPPVW